MKLSRKIVFRTEQRRKGEPLAQVTWKTIFKIKVMVVFCLYKLFEQCYAEYDAW